MKTKNNIVTSQAKRRVQMGPATALWNRLASAESSSTKSTGHLKPKEILLRTDEPAAAKSIDFGHFRRATHSSPKEGVDTWHKLLGHAARGTGFTEIGGGGLAALAEAGISKLFSGLANLGRHTKPEPALVPFRLSEPRNLTLTVEAPAQELKASGQTVDATQPRSTLNSGVIYPQQVTQIVKQALLTSSVLNDLIAEI